jgi:hypothetical protein
MNAINEAWNSEDGKFGDYNVTVEAYVVDIENQYVDMSEVNTINIHEGNGDPSVDIGDGNWNQGNWFTEDTDRIIAHEAGHLMGHDDRIRRDPDFKCFNVTIAAKGWENNVMSYDKLGLVNEKNFDVILNNKDGSNAAIYNTDEKKEDN